LWLKQKKVILVALVVLFVVAIFATRTKAVFKNNKTEGGLVYNGTETIGELVNKDTDGDTVPDWEESLLGTDPTKKDTDGDGTPDDIEIEKKKRDRSLVTGASVDASKSLEDLNKTDQLSRELFSTIAALSQAGTVDDGTVDTLSDSLIERIQNSTPKKVFVASDLKIIKDNSANAVRDYNNALNKIFTKEPIKYTVFDVLDKFIIDSENVDTDALLELHPLIKQSNAIVDGIVKMSVPESLVTLHLELVNSIQSLAENMSSIALYESDIVIALNGLTQYQKNTEILEDSSNKLYEAINQKINN